MSETTPPANEVGRYQLVQTSDGRTPMLIDTVTGKSWFRIAAGADHYAWRPMRFEPAGAETPPA